MSEPSTSTAAAGQNGANADKESNNRPDADQDQDDDIMEEEEHFEQIVAVFKQYGAHVQKDVQRDYLCYSRLPEAQRKMLYPSYPQHLVSLKKAAMHNHRLLSAIIQGVGGMFENADHGADEAAAAGRTVSAFQMDKLHSSIKQIVRDWTAEGAAERDECYKPVMDIIKARFEVPDSTRHTIRILVPGAGLGRLAWQLAHAGYTCQGNEFSLYMLFISNFILNKAIKVNSLFLYPWLHEKCNNLSYDDQLRKAEFPDVDVTDLPKNPHRFSMAAGEFCEVYSRPEELGAWHCVASVFFIDTAHNVIDYLQCIYNALRPGGIWINLGPLLYHFADMPNEDSIELPYEEIKRLLGIVGFELLEERVNMPCTYTQNTRSMLQYHYRAVMFVAKKPEDAV